VTVYEGIVRRGADNDVDTCYIDDKGDLLFSYRGQFGSNAEIQNFVDENNIRFSVCFGPILIQDGVRYDRGHYGLGEITCYYPRAALCQLGELHYMVVTANSTDTYPRLPSLYTFGDHLLARGITTAYTLDGGQTGVIAMNGVMINPVQYDYQRAISDIIYFATALPDGD
jgi:exopolysaccharide biosynthesis protein